MFCKTMPVTTSTDSTAHLQLSTACSGILQSRRRLSSLLLQLRDRADGQEASLGFAAYRQSAVLQAHTHSNWQPLPNPSNSAQRSTAQHTPATQASAYLRPLGQHWLRLLNECLKLRGIVRPLLGKPDDRATAAAVC